MGPESVTRSQVLRYRRRANHLDQRLAREDVNKAAYVGLQDSVPRSALLSLHARVEDVAFDAWDDPKLVRCGVHGDLCASFRRKTLRCSHWVGCHVMPSSIALSAKTPDGLETSWSLRTGPASRLSREGLSAGFGRLQQPGPFGFVGTEAASRSGQTSLLMPMSRPAGWSWRADTCTSLHLPRLRISQRGPGRPPRRKRHLDGSPR